MDWYCTQALKELIEEKTKGNKFAKSVNNTLVALKEDIKKLQTTSEGTEKTLKIVAETAKSLLTSHSKVETSCNKVSRDLVSYADKLRKNVAVTGKTLYTNSSNPGNLHDPAPYDPKKTVIISNIPRTWDVYQNANPNSKSKSSIPLLRALTKKFEDIKPVRAIPGQKGAMVTFQFPTEDQANRVNTEWKPEFFGGGTSCR